MLCIPRFTLHSCSIITWDILPAFVWTASLRHPVRGNKKHLTSRIRTYNSRNLILANQRMVVKVFIIAPSVNKNASLEVLLSHVDTGTQAIGLKRKIKPTPFRSTLSKVEYQVPIHFKVVSKSLYMGRNSKRKNIRRNTSQKWMQTVSVQKRIFGLVLIKRR